MNETINPNLEESSTQYFYRITMSIGTLGIDTGKYPHFDLVEEFKSDDLLLCKMMAESSYWERFYGVDEIPYYLPLHGPVGFEHGKHAACSLSLLLVECSPDGSEIEHPLLGEDENEMQESAEIESMVLEARYKYNANQ